MRSSDADHQSRLSFEHVSADDAGGRVKVMTGADRRNTGCRGLGLIRSTMATVVILAQFAAMPVYAGQTPALPQRGGATGGATTQSPAQVPLPGSAKQSWNDPMVDVWSSIREGDALVEAAQYDEAIASYQTALERLSGDPEWAIQHNAVRRLLASAYVGAYRIHRRLTDLRKARDLLTVFLSELDEASPDRGPAEQLIEEIDTEVTARRAEADAEEQHAQDQRKAEAEAKEARESRIENHVRDASGRRMIIAGSIVASIGALAAIPAILGKTGEVRRRRLANELLEANALETEDGRTNADLKREAESRLSMSLVSVIAGSTTLLTGVILMAAGGGKRKSVLDSRAAAFVPMRGGGVVQMSWRF